MNRSNNIFHRMISLVLVFALVLTVCPVGVHAQEMAESVPLVIDGTTHCLDFRFIGDTLYCPADQWAQATNALWSFTPNQKTVNIYSKYKDGLLIYSRFNDQEYVEDGSVYWIPFFDAAKHRAVFFTSVKNDQVIGYQAKSLALFYNYLGEMFKHSNYRIYSLNESLGIAWYVASTVARSYAILSTMSIKGGIDAVAGKMDQDLFNRVLQDMLAVDEALLVAISDDEEERISRGFEIAHLLREAAEEGGGLGEEMAKMGIGEGVIQEICSALSEYRYGELTVADLSDIYQIGDAVNIFELLAMLDDLCAWSEADTHAIIAMQKVFSHSSNDHVRHAVRKAVETKLGSKAIASGVYTLEYLTNVLQDKVIGDLEDSIADGLGVDSWETLKAKVVLWLCDETFSLTDKSDAIMYANVAGLIQLELMDYFYEHYRDAEADTGLLMHSVALLYLRSCLASWQKFEFDGSLSKPINTAKTTISAEIKELMSYTEAELLQNGTSVECEQAITELVRRKLADMEPEETVPAVTVPEATIPAVDNSYLYQDAMDAYAQLLQNGVMLRTADDDYVAATHYQLLDMDLDGLPEIVVFTVYDYVSLFEVYSYRNDTAWIIGDSLNTCEVSQWYNAGHDLIICDGNKLYAAADKVTAMYSDGMWGFLHYDGSTMWYEDGGLYGATIDEELIDSCNIVGGIRIGSDSDPLAKPKEPDEWTEETWEEPEEWTEKPWEEPEEWTEEPWEEPETESEEEFDIPYDRPSDGVYYYSLVDCPSLDSDAFHIYLRDSWQDYETFLNGVWQTSPMGITFQHNAGYEVYNVEFWCGIEDNANGTFVIHTKALDGSGTEYRYVIEEGGYISPYDSNGNLGTGYGPKFCWFTHQRLEADDNCVFADDRLIYSSERIEMSMDEFRDALNQADSFVGSYTEVHVTIQDGKITELTLPYIP